MNRVILRWPKQLADCDCCGRPRADLRQCWVTGIETWACAVCRGEEPEVYRDQPEEVK